MLVLFTVPPLTEWGRDQIGMLTWLCFAVETLKLYRPLTGVLTRNGCPRAVLQ